jgi:shikimate dehydrogenase
MGGSRYGLLGKTLQHSYSKEIHESMGVYGFSLWEKTPEELDFFLKAKDFDGAMVTIPYKEKVLEYVEEMSPEAAALGSANLLLKNRQGELQAYNTDLEGFRYMIQRAGLNLCGKKVLVLGDGATGRTAVHVMRTMGASEIRVASRRGKEGKQGEVEVVSYNRGWPQADVLINTTPVGMYPQNGEVLVELSRFPFLEAVFDVIYNPMFTSLLLQARDRGLVTGNGLSMLVAQGVLGAEIFLKGKLPGGKNREEWTETILEQLRERLTNRVLVGMPGSGKTTYGKKMAEVTGKIFVDTDDLVEQHSGQTISALFQEGGEPLFRRWEKEVALEIGKRTGQVIATGGGMVLQREAMDALRQNGRILWVKRPLEELACEGRPLSKDLPALEEMARQREPLYKKYAEEVFLKKSVEREQKDE